MVKRVTAKRAEPEAPEPEAVEYDDLRELEDALRIDEHALEKALCDQPELFYCVSRAYALEISRRDAAKQALQDAEAETDLRIRDQARRDDQKITEGEVRATIQIDGRVTQAQAHLARRNEWVAKLGALKEAFQQRSYALKDLAGLYVANYYTASDHNAASGAVRTRDAAEARARMNEARNKK